jgi:hypothetical protein
MGIRLADLQKRTRKITVVFQDEPVTVEYLVNVITPAFVAEKTDMVAQIKEAVVAWDVLDEDGKPIPPAEIADHLPLAFLGVVMEAIVADMRGVLGEKKD